MSKRLKFLLPLCCFGMLFLSAPAGLLGDLPNTVQAAETEEYGISPLMDRIDWRFKMINGKLYKRLFNYSMDEWIGDWIPVVP